MQAERDSLALVLRLVRSGAVATRQEIERFSRLGRAMVADRVATLVARGLIAEDEIGESNGGRAPKLVRFNAAAGHILVASLGTTTLGVGLADLSGRLLVEHHEPGDIRLGAEKTLERIDALFEWMLGEHPAARDLWGIGLAVPGWVELADGRLSSEPHLHLAPGWDRFPIRDHLVARFAAPVWMDNEVHLMALGELRGGRGVGRQDLLFVKVGTAIGAGLCSHGQVHRGAAGYAGDLGHVAVTDGPTAICRCGNTGCLEVLAGGDAIAREGQLAADDGRSPHLADLARDRAITAADVGMAADLGDPVSIELMSRSGGLIGSALAILVNAYDPGLVVVGGGVAQSGEILIASMREALYRRSRSPAIQDLKVVRSEMGKTAGLVGAALAVIEELFSPENVRSWIDVGSPVTNLGGTGAGEVGTLSPVARRAPRRRSETGTRPAAAQPVGKPR